ncbi:PepSY domain-containing protein [Altererythrobacter xixiisoli]|uniref:PepSY domain-containing protein n=1 Tax=Croceibacterium xixiisoli TaxID=1476466 RepID=A0A6I4TVG0_9SPHN|nr:PepSY-associated TM helix domain-containing protein [Croceibacterium xixiisoli]MXO98767.1 PepSY domain-containing protein [Croceibacterium xixiisoli]
MASTTPKPVKKPARKPLLSRVPADFVRAVLKGHSALGLAFAAAIYLVCLTGTVAVFAQEFERWEHPAAPQQATPSPNAVQQALASAIARNGAPAEHGYIQMPTPALPFLSAHVEGEDGYRGWIANAQGNLVESGQSPWTLFITRLHINLHLPQTWGVFLVGLTGVALLSSLISGILAHPRIFRDAFHLRIGGSRRLQEADLHNRLGVWALPFHVLVSLSGALLGLTTLIVGVLGMALFQGDVGKVYELFLPAEPIDDPRPAPTIDLVPMFAQLQTIAPDGRITLVQLEHPGEMGGAALFQVEQDNGRLGNTDSFAFRRDGTLYYDARSADNNLGEAILASLGKLHFGWFGGGIIKIAYALLGLGLTYLASSGVTIWLARRRDKRNAAPGWEKLWAGTVWGQPAALAAAALAGVVGGAETPVSVLIGLWGAITVVSLCSAALPASAAQIGRGFQWLSAVLLIATALFHAFALPGSDPIAWIVDLSLFAIGVTIGWWAYSRKPAPANQAVP